MFWKDAVIVAERRLLHNSMHRLKKNKEFNYIYKKGERVSTEHFTLFVVKSKYENYKIGFSVSKKLGKANKRNKLKRRLKEIVRKDIKVLPFRNYVLLAREGVQELDFILLKEEIIFLFKKYEKKKVI